MKHFLFLVLLAAVTVTPGSAQTPPLTQADMQTLSYEDLSDLLRRFPGMYPLDYGVLGAPLVFRPWQMQPWQLRVREDGIPLWRVMDGIYEPNLDPVSEIGAIEYDFPGSPGGAFNLSTRTLPVDSPYTELQVREGYYGFGTVDFAHGQRVGRDVTLEITGRLGWYDGLRGESTRSRLNRLRGRVGFGIARGWRTWLTYEGSRVEAESEVQPQGTNRYTEREQGTVSVARVDSEMTRLLPSVSLFLRQDREIWGGRFRSREATGGWVAAVGTHLPRQRIEIRHTAMLSKIDAPGIVAHDELYLEAEGRDSVDLEMAGVTLHGSVRRESARRLDGGEGWAPLVGGGVDLRTRTVSGAFAYGGVAYAESTVPILWTEGNYVIGDRPVLIDSAFAGMLNRYTGSEMDGVRGVDRFLSSRFGIGYRRGGTRLDVALMTIDRMGEFGNRFVRGDTTTYLVYDKQADLRSRYGVSTVLRLPLWYGLRVDSWWSGLSYDDDAGEVIESRSFSRLYFERDFFQSPLTVRAHVSYEYIGARDAFSSFNSTLLPSVGVIGFRVSGTIGGVTLIWGAENLNDAVYSHVPGYRMIHKEEYFGVIWKLWL